jgi:hypothetical protein
MANKKILLGMLAVLLVFGFTLVGCEYGDPGLEGSWKKTTSTSTYTTVITLTFTAGDYESKTVQTTTSTGNSTTTKENGTYVASNGLLGRTITSTTSAAGVTTPSTTTSSTKYVIYGSTLLINGSSGATGVFTKE